MPKTFDPGSILVATDFSDCANRALSQALEISQLLGAKVHALHVIHWPRQEMKAASEAQEHPGIAEARQLSSERFEQINRDDDKVSFEVVVADNVSDAILGSIQDGDFGMVVIGSHGYNPVRRAILGTTADLVVRHSPIPVLLARDESGKAAIKRILVPVDFSDQTDILLSVADRLAQAADAKIDVLHVVPLLSAPFYDVDKLKALREKALQRAKEEVERRVANVLGDSDHVSIEVQTDDPVVAIIRYAKETKCDLLIISTHGLSGVVENLIGGVAERVARRSKCSVLITRTFGRPTLAGDES